MVMVIMGCIWSATWRSTHMFLLNRHGSMSLEWFRMHGNDSTKNVSWVMTDANPLPSSFTKLCLNAARMVPLMYSYDTNSPSKLARRVCEIVALWWCYAEYFRKSDHCFMKWCYIYRADRDIYNLARPQQIKLFYVLIRVY